MDAFIAVSTQWRVIHLAGGQAYWQGLDYGAVQAGWSLARLDVTPQQWIGVQRMERAAANVLNGYRD